MIKAEELQQEMCQFYGTEHYYRYPVFGAKAVLLTDGAQWLAKQGFCWLIDMIALRQPKCQKDDMLQYMQFWTLKTDLSTNKATLICERDSDDVFLSEEIPYTDCPVEELKLYCAPTEAEAGIEYLIYLPSEH